MHLSRYAAVLGLVLPLLFVLTGVSHAQSASGTASSGAPDEAVREVVEAFHDALASGDSAAALARLHEDAVVYEGGHAESRSEYRSGHLAADIRFSRGMDRSVVRDAVTASGEMALYESQYRMTGTQDGRELTIHGTETIVLVPAEGGWEIRHIHWSSRREE